jgi:hypothetical protein
LNTKHRIDINVICLVAVSNTSHTTHHAEHVVVNGIHTDLSGGSSTNSGGRDNELEGGIVNTREVARSRRLVLLGAESEGIHVDTSIGVAGVVLEGLDGIEVGTFTLRETVLAVKLELGSDNWVFSPAVHVEGSLGKNECSSIRKTRCTSSSEGILTAPLGISCNIRGTGHLEKTRGGDESVGTRCLGRSSESMDSIRKSI